MTWILTGSGLSVLTAWLFYRSLYGLISAVFLLPLCRKVLLEEEQRKERDRVLGQFREMMRLVSDAMAAGYPLERAWLEAERELALLWEQEEVMNRELHQMNRQAALKVPLEDSLEAFAERYDLEDAADFAQILRFARRSGGDFPQIIRTTVLRITEKETLQEDIAVMLADRQLEQKLMCVLPLGILAMMSMQNGEFLSPLYGSVTGVILMTGMLILYGAAVLLAIRIMRVEV